MHASCTQQIADFLIEGGIRLQNSQQATEVIASHVSLTGLEVVSISSVAANVVSDVELTVSGEW